VPGARDAELLGAAFAIEDDDPRRDAVTQPVTPNGEIERHAA
jgi:hypothetical protein